MTTAREFAILVVEDEPLLLIDAVDMFMDEGFVVYSARDADQAIRHLEQHDEIRILFTDVDMPGSMDGLKLARAVRDGWPPVCIMVTSGLRDVKAADLPGEGRFFAKPYPPGEVMKAVKEIVAKLDG
ncbi:response regulator [Fulvimarina sp. MAC8]|uniref:response regulator n=1 Tax=Fulvimarina sp. MAC8 TaxID=3162874 RepID=UPI0032EE770C